MYKVLIIENKKKVAYQQEATSLKEALDIGLKMITHRFGEWFKVSDDEWNIVAEVKDPNLTNN